MRHWSENEIERIRRLAAEGYSIFEIAEELDRKYSSTADKMHNLGIKATMKHERKTDPTQQEIADRAARIRQRWYAERGVCHVA